MEYPLCIQFDFQLCQSSNFRKELLNSVHRRLLSRPVTPPSRDALPSYAAPTTISSDNLWTTDCCASPSKVTGHHSDWRRRQPPLRPTGLRNPPPPPQSKESRWYRGAPSPATPGSRALRLSRGLHLDLWVYKQGCLCKGMQQLHAGASQTS